MYTGLYVCDVTLLKWIHSSLFKRHLLQFVRVQLTGAVCVQFMKHSADRCQHTAAELIPFKGCLLSTDTITSRVTWATAMGDSEQ